MIDLSLDVEQVFEQQDTRVCIQVSNPYHQPCTSIIFDLDFQPGLLVIRGRKSVEIDRLSAGETRSLDFHLRARQAGEYAIRVTGFSYRDPAGRVQRPGDQKLILHAAPYTAPAKPFEVTLANNLILGERGRLRVTVRNLDYMTYQGLSVNIKGKLKCEPAGLPPLPSGALVSIDLSVKPLEHGWLPVKVQLHTASGAVLFSQQDHLQISWPGVAESEAVPRGNTTNIGEVKDSTFIIQYPGGQQFDGPPSMTQAADERSRSKVMDPGSLIINALLMGISHGVMETAGAAVKDLYTAFKTRLQKFVGGNENAQEALVLVENKPELKARQEVLKEALSELRVDQDEDLLRAAQKFLETIDEPGAKAGKYTINIQHGENIVIGDNANVTQNITKQ